MNPFPATRLSGIIRHLMIFYPKFALISTKTKTETETTTTMVAEKGLSFPAVIKHDEESNLFTAYLTELPGVIAEGETEEESFLNLIKSLRAFLAIQNEKVQGKVKYMENTTTKTLDLVEA